MTADLRSSPSVHIVGLGLIGGSIGLGLRSAGSRWTVTGSDTRPEVIETALSLGAITGSEPPAHCDIVVIAVPPAAVPKVFKVHEVLLRSARAWTDVCSVKSFVREATPQALRPNGVLGHPMAGAEVGGIRHARADLFHGAPWAIVDDAPTEEAVALIRELIRTLRGIPVSRKVHDHDAEVAMTSHLPHAVATQLLHLSRTTSCQLAGGSWRDATRVGGAEPELWTQIFSHNAEAMQAKLMEIEAGLAQLRTWIAEGNQAAIRAWLEQAQTIKSERT